MTCKVSEVVENRPRKLEAILRCIDHLGRGAQDLHIRPEQRQGNVVGGLAAHRQDDTGGVLELVDVQDGLEGDVLEVETVGLVVVCKMSAAVGSGLGKKGCTGQCSRSQDYTSGVVSVFL